MAFFIFFFKLYLRLDLLLAGAPDDHARPRGAPPHPPLDHAQRGTLYLNVIKDV